MAQKDFTFLVFCCNHEQYIVEHLESIKHLIFLHGAEIDIDIIINDDFSKDSTVKIINRWFDLNFKLFRKITKLFNEKNIGTCASVVNALNEVKTADFKITAGDDVYSYENIFEYGRLRDEVSMLSGIPVQIINGVLKNDIKEALGVALSQEIYKNKPLIKRFSLVSNNNSPNMIFNGKYILSDSCKKFIGNYDVVEDWPIQIHVATNHPETKFEMVNKVFVYYRRTINSTFIVANDKFTHDKRNIYDFILKNSDGCIDKFLISNRKFLFLKKNKYYNKLFNLSFLLFAFNGFWHLRNAFFRVKQIKFNEYILHYAEIKKKAALFNESV